MLKASIEQLDAVSIAAVLAACLICAVTDLRRFKVYNWVTVPFFIAGLIYNSAILGLEGFQSSLLGAGCGFLLLFFLFVFGKAGAGDVKLLAGLGAWLGAATVFRIFLISTIAGGVFAIIAMLCTRSVRESFWRFVGLLIRFAVPGSGDGETVQDIVKRGDQRSRLIPFAFALFIGTTIVLLNRT